MEWSYRQHQQSDPNGTRNQNIMKMIVYHTCKQSKRSARHTQRTVEQRLRLLNDWGHGVRASWVQATRCQLP